MSFEVDALTGKLNSVSDIEIIPELEEIIKGKFTVSTKEDVLFPLVDDADVIIGGGACFGDEGKGKTVDGVATHPDIEVTARVNSGENAGHTVYYKGEKFIFHLIPSGIFTGKTNIISDNCVMDPVSFMNKEISNLVENDVDYLNLYVGNVGIVTPYHKIMDAMGAKNSSTLKGMSPVHASKSRKKMPRLNDLFNSEEHQRRVFNKDMEVYRGLLKENDITENQLLKRFEKMNEKSPNQIPEHVINFLKSKDKEGFLVDLYKDTVSENKNFPKRENTKQIMQNILKNGKKILLEGPQSYWLSNMVDTHFRSSTSADTTSAGILAASGINVAKYRALVINVHKNPASSRVGLGANVAGYVPQDFFSRQNIDTLEDLKGICEDFDAIQKQFFDSIGENGILKMTEYTDTDGTKYPVAVAMAIASARTYGEEGATTKKPRITGLFDCVAHWQVNEAQGPYLTISAFDRGDLTDKFGLVVAYVVSNPDNLKLESDGKEYKHGEIIRPGQPLPNENVLYHCQPIIKVLDGWKGNPIAADKRSENDELPEQAQRVLAEIEGYTQAKIISVGNGKESHNLIYLQRKPINYSNLEKTNLRHILQK
ncbi:adenylosuccinate synthetase [Bacteroidota bacterium]